MQAARPESRPLSKKRPRRFGKPGRPVKDAVAERLRIYRAASPLLVRNGVRRTTVQEVARASCLSPGGIYHYFGSKTDVALYGLRPEALSRACTDAGREVARCLSSGRPDNGETAIRIFVEKNVLMFEFVRPALLAAVELGRPELQKRLTAGLRQDADSFVSTMRSFQPRFVAGDELAETLRRAVLGLALDDSVTTQEARRQIDWLLRRLLT